ncbi:MAG: galactokinase family protein [Saprospiraceae bacterium]
MGNTEDYVKRLREHELIIQAPGRINLIGEHTDYNGGLALPAAISQSIFLGISRSEEFLVTALDRQETSNLSSMEHNWVVYIKGVLDLIAVEVAVLPPFRMEFGGDLPSGAGLSSSSALTCGLVRALNELFSLGLSIEEETKLSVIAEKSSGLLGGMMDQITILNGKADYALLINCSNWSFEYVAAELEGFTWLIVDTKVKHNLVDSDYNNRSSSCNNIKKILSANSFIVDYISELRFEHIDKVKSLLSELEFTYLKYVLEENDRVRHFVKSLRNQDPVQLGKILFEGHKGLKEYYKVSCEELDFLVDFAEENKLCLGARMMGGGFGGCTIHLLPSQFQEEYSLEISASYKRKFGFSPFIFAAKITDGVRRIT